MKRHMKTVNLDGSPYEKNRQVIRDLQVTPLRIPYAVNQEVCAELERAIEYKPDGWDVYLQMYTELVPLKGVRSKFEVFGLDEKGTRYPVYRSDFFEMPRAFHILNYKTRGLASSGTQAVYTPGVFLRTQHCT